MRIRRVLIAVGCSCALFLCFQLILFRDVSQGKTTSKNVTSREFLQEENSAYRNIKEFATVCHKQGIPVVLIDAFILGLVMNSSNTSASSPSSSSSHSKCRYLCVHQPITTFAVVASLWKHQNDFVGIMRGARFSVAYTLQHKPDWLSESDASSVPTHYVFVRRGHTIHLVVFYERLAHSWWYGHLRGNSEAPGNHQMLGDVGVIGDLVNSSDQTLTQPEGIFDRFEMVKVTIDGVNIRAPRYPTTFLAQVPHARFQECNRTRAASFRAVYGGDDSTHAKEFRHHATEVLTTAKKTLDELGIPFWLSSGTCLGWYRQCDLIPYSGDVDIGVWIKHYDVRMIPAMQAAGLPLRHLFGKEGDSFELSFQTGRLKLDVFFFYEADGHMWNGGTQAKTGHKFKYIFPKFTLCWTEFLGLKLRAPCETLKYVEANYGSNWFEPVKVWDWKHSPPNVQENGVWPKSEWDQVIQTFGEG